MTARLLIGDVFDRMAELPDGSVDLVLTSPPFLALRSYLPADHPDKAKEIGSEPTPAAFIDTLLRLSAEWRRLLAPHGSICVELGDTYSGSGGAGGDYGEGGLRDGQERFSGSASRVRNGTAYDADYDKSQRGKARGGSGRWGQRIDTGGSGWPLDKSLCLVPELYRVGLVYGINPLTGQPSPAGRWRVRNVVRWCRPNPPVGALGDKFRPATSEMVVACLARDRWFDLDAVREPAARQGFTTRDPRMRGDVPQGEPHQTMRVEISASAPPLDWWDIPTHPYKGAHYATWPPALCTRPILAMCPRKVCTTCGEPSRRIVETTRPTAADDRQRRKNANGERPAAGRMDRPPEIGWEVERITVGWTDCGHNTWRPGLVLDPFAGSGTTLAAAVGHGRDATGIDLDPRNANLARERCGMFLDIEHGTREQAS